MQIAQNSVDVCKARIFQPGTLSVSLSDLSPVDEFCRSKG